MSIQGLVFRYRVMRGEAGLGHLAVSVPAHLRSTAAHGIAWPLHCIAWHPRTLRTLQQPPSLASDNHTCRVPPQPQVLHQALDCTLLPLLSYQLGTIYAC